jgi:hypothetical protein
VSNEAQRARKTIKMMSYPRGTVFRAPIKQSTWRAGFQQKSNFEGSIIFKVSSVEDEQERWSME